MKCWFVNVGGEYGMFGHGKTRSQAIKWVLDRYDDAAFDDYARGELDISAVRVPEFDGRAEVEYDALAVLRRGFWIYCARCDRAGLVASRFRWPPNDLYYDDAGFYQAYLVDGEVICGPCADADIGDSSAIELMDGMEPRV